MCDPSTLTPDQQTTLQQFKAAIQAERIETVSDYNLTRFLVGYKWKIDKALELYREERKWFHEIRPDLIIADDVRNEIKDGLFFFTAKGAVDMKGNLLVFINANLYDKHLMTGERLLQALLFLLEESIRRFSSMAQRLAVVVNMKSVKWGNFYDRKSFSRIAKTLNDYYCERLRDCFIVSPPSLFRFGWAIVKGFLDPVTRDKIHLTSRRGLQKYINPEFIPISLRGTYEDFNSEKWMAEIGITPLKPITPSKSKGPSEQGSSEEQAEQRPEKLSEVPPEPKHPPIPAE